VEVDLLGVRGLGQQRAIECGEDASRHELVFRVGCDQRRREASAGQGRRQDRLGEGKDPFVPTL
jgi:hypothetical protein